MPRSRYRNVNQIPSEPGIPQHYETSDFPTEAELDKVPTFKIRAAKFDRLDSLAFKHLGAGEYWWIIALINGLEWMYDFDEGQILKIPINVDDVLRLI